MMGFIGIYPEWNVKTLKKNDDENQLELEYIQNGM